MEIRGGHVSSTPHAASEAAPRPNHPLLPVSRRVGSGQRRLRDVCEVLLVQAAQVPPGPRGANLRRPVPPREEQPAYDIGVQSVARVRHPRCIGPGGHTPLGDGCNAASM